MSLIEESETQQNKNELIKHSSAIHIKSDLSLVDRKVMNILLRNAYDSLDSARYHSIRLSELKNLIGWSSKNYNSLKKSLGKLVTTKVEWNIFKKDKKNEWGVSSVLASASIAGGKCVYDYSHHLKTLFKNPNVYSRISLAIQNNFKSKHSLILWEFLTDSLAIENKDGVKTDWIKIEDYKNLLGTETEKYKTFKTLNEKLIKLPIEEINQVSNIEVEVIYQKVSAKVTAIKFIAKRKVPKAKKVEIIEATNDPKTGSLSFKFHSFETDTKKEIRGKLAGLFKLSDGAINSILKNYKEEQILANIAYIESENKKGLIKNLAAYSFNAIKNDFRLVTAPIKNSDSESVPIIKEKPIEFDNENPLWLKSLALLKNNFDEYFFNKWISELNFIRALDDVLILAVKTKFLRDWIQREYTAEIEKILTQKINIIAVEK